MRFSPEEIAKLDPQQREAMDALTSDKFVNFLAAAYHVPSEARVTLIEKLDAVVERNFMLMVMSFCCFLYHKDKRIVMPDPSVLPELLTRFDEFLADAVKQTFWK